MQAQVSICAANRATFRAAREFVLHEVLKMNIQVFDVAYAVIGEADLPDVSLPL